MFSLWRPFNVVLHIIWFVAFIVVLRDYHFVDPTLYNAVLASKEREVFALAVQLGRLDFLNSVLAILGLIFAAAAVFGFLEIRGRAEREAQKAAKDEAARWMNEHGPAAVQNYLDLIAPFDSDDDDGGDDKADEMAREA